MKGETKEEGGMHSLSKVNRFGLKNENRRIFDTTKPLGRDEKETKRMEFSKKRTILQHSTTRESAFESTQ